jgi:hypothetical protein
MELKEFSTEDREKVKREVLRMIFPALTIFLFIFLTDFVYASLESSFSVVFYSILAMAILVSVISFYFMTRKLILDIRNGKATIKSSVIQEKNHKKDYEPGSAYPGGPFSYYINKIFPWFRYENKEREIYYMVVNDERIYLTEDEFKMIENKETVNIRLSKEAELYLGLDEL